MPATGGCRREAPASASQPSAAAESASAAETPAISEPTAAQLKILQPWSGDFDGMIARRSIRVLVTYSKTHYFVDKGTQRGLTYETVDGLFEGSNILAGGTTVQLTVSGRGNVPAGDQTVVLNVTAISSPGSGFVTAYPCGVQRPDVSVLNMVPGTTVNNHLVVDTGTDGKVCVYVSTGTHLLVDVEGVLP